MRRAITALVVVLTSAAGACFSPDFDDGAIPCGAQGQCPEGFSCASVDSRCYREGHAPRSCSPGFKLVSGACVDIDECMTGAAACDPKATCTNSAGSYSCACPATGYTGDGKTCTDIDECMTGAAGCDDHATCSNSPGAFTCACSPGYAGPGTACWPDYTSFAAGSEHGCAVRADGALFCWGDNSAGQLALPADTAEVHAPRRIGSELWSSVSASMRTTCGVRRDNTLWCWGENGCGVVGNNATPDIFCDGVRPVFEMFPTGGSGGRFRSVSVGRSHACAVGMDGALWCWGQNDGGDLGTSDDGNHLVPTRVGADAAADKNWEAVAAGERHSCGLRAGQLWCWGSNNRGQLGDDLAEARISFPKRIGTAAAWQSLAAGDDHTCAILDGGGMSCWGGGDSGQLGDGKSGAGTQENSPATLAPPTGTTWAQVAAGSNMTCARSAARRLYCFGENTYGELGDGSFADKDRPAVVGRPPDEDWDRATVGFHVACARKSDGRLLCWGRNLSGAVGVGTGGDAVTPRETRLTGFSQLAMGGYHSCGIKGVDKSLWCWGYNASGELGIGAAGGARDEPTQVRGGGMWSQVSVGENSTCAIRASGELYCWGANSSGQLGTGAEGSDAAETSPARVMDGNKTWVKIALRSSHACGLQTGGGLYCWGASSLGRLGVGTVTGDVLVPRRVGEDLWTHVTTGNFHSCGLRAGSLYCWGYDGDGELGLGAQPPDNANQLVPARVGTATDWVTIAAGGYHTCGLRGAGNQLTCWGHNFYGQVGNGSSGASAAQRSPATISFGSHWLSISPGDLTTCGVSSDMNLFCWGTNSRGLVGNGLVGTVVPTPVMIDASKTFTTAALGNQAACGLRLDGATACWGASTLGEFGDGTSFYETPTLVAE